MNAKLIFKAIFYILTLKFFTFDEPVSPKKYK